MPDLHFVSPMLAAEGALPTGDGWALEIKVDGQRLLAGNDDGPLRLWSRSGQLVTTCFPELVPLAAQLPPGTLVDGEVAVFDEEGISRLALMRHRIGGLGKVQQQTTWPVMFVIFDLLRLPGRDTMQLPYAERRQLLDDLRLSGLHWRTPQYHVGDAERLFAATRERGLEGLVAKRLGSPYKPGERSRAWLKLKHRQQSAFVVVGWRPDAHGAVNSILVAERELGGGLTYRGSVTNGISAGNRALLMEVLEAMSGSQARLDGEQPQRAYTPVALGLMALIEFQERTQAGWLRDASFVGFIKEGDSK